MRFRNAAVLAAGLFVSSVSFAGPVVSGFDSNTLARNDDGYTGLVGIGFDINFFGNTYSQLYVNNNGNVTFNYPIEKYTPSSLGLLGSVFIAPFFADVDTRYAGSPVTYGNGVYDGQTAFGVNWVDVDYYDSDPSHTARNSFQLIFVDRSDGDFDIIFNYDDIQWEAGEASDSGPDGLGGTAARAGWASGTGEFYELAGSGVNGAFINGGPNALVSNSFNSGVAGRYVFEVRNGVISTPIPEPETWAMLLAGLGVVGVTAKRRRRRK
ncbi:MAG: PEPxxWA-CTERM sorting domain-containing protein [Betaproteobacteria bacterium]|nr:PEPxxWA-CTERM sorting domain-containing protein [Betaproteobacteria bacterium]